MARIASCHTDGTASRKKNGGNGRTRSASSGRGLTIALAGNSNVGKSVIFNQLTGSHQTIGNWPGKTVESAEGTLHFNGYDATIVDLPGIYSLSTFSLEEIVTREYIAEERPDVIVNVIGAPVLERNLFFTLQLMEMGVPMVVCLNQTDIAESKGIMIDARKLEAALGVPVVATVAARGKGVRELMERVAQVAEGKETGLGLVRFRDGIETDVAELTHLLESPPLDLEYSSRWVAIKLLEGDVKVRELVTPKSESVVRASEDMAAKLEAQHNETRYAVVAAARYVVAAEIARGVQSQVTIQPTFGDTLERLATHKVFGYVISVAVIAGLLLWTFTVGNYLSTVLSNAFAFFQPLDPKISGTLWSIIWNGVFGGLVAGVTLVVPFVVPFYLMLAAMEDSGILTRVAFMMDSAMHQMGLHGKAIIPLILGYGCNVPAIYTTRIMGTRRERLLASFAITFAPCAARTIVVLGLVSAFVGTGWALALYAIDLLIMFIALKVAVKAVPGDVTGMIMEMHSFKAPSFSVVTKQTWARTKSLVYMVFPMYMIGSAAVQAAYAFGVLNPVNAVMSPLTVAWLGLPAIAGVLLVFGIVRKELILLTLVAIYGANLTGVLTSAQFIVLALVGMLYLPCIATIGILAKEFGWKASVVMSVANLVVALLVGGLMARVLGFVM